MGNIIQCPLWCSETSGKEPHESSVDPRSLT